MQTFTKEIDKLRSADVAVVGGGVAGCAAAICAARRNAKTILIEQTGTLGGQAGFGLVTPLSSTHSRSGESFGGLIDEILEELKRLSGKYCVPEGEAPGSLIAAPHILSYVLLKLCTEAGVDIRFHTTLIDAKTDGDRVVSLICAEKSALSMIEAKQFIDASGDGDLLAFCKDSYSLGSEPGVLDSLTKTGLDEVHFTKDGDREHKYSGYGDTRELQPVSLFFTMGGVEFAKAFVLNNKYLTYENMGISYEEYSRLPYAGKCGFEQIEGDEKLPLPQGRVLVTRGVRRDIAVINMSRVIGIDGSDSDSLNKGELLAQEQVMNLVDFLIAHVPGFEHAYYIECATSLGIRETRRLVGKYVLTGYDVISCRAFPDAIARGSYLIDIHDPKGKAKAIGGEIKGDYYEIPLRCLESAKYANLFAAGRCISADHVAHSSTRIQGTCILTGSAAGEEAAKRI